MLLSLSILASLTLVSAAQFNIVDTTDPLNPNALTSLTRPPTITFTVVENYPLNAPETSKYATIKNALSIKSAVRNEPDLICSTVMQHSIINLGLVFYILRREAAILVEVLPRSLDAFARLGPQQYLIIEYESNPTVFMYGLKEVGVGIAPICVPLIRSMDALGIFTGDFGLPAGNILTSYAHSRLTERGARLTVIEERQVMTFINGLRNRLYQDVNAWFNPTLGAAAPGTVGPGVGPRPAPNGDGVPDAGAVPENGDGAAPGARVPSSAEEKDKEDKRRLEEERTKRLEQITPSSTFGEIVPAHMLERMEREAEERRRLEQEEKRRREAAANGNEILSSIGSPVSEQGPGDSVVSAAPGEVPASETPLSTIEEAAEAISPIDTSNEADSTEYATAPSGGEE